ncbi:hypothetical protein ACHQM5_015963 [Ranunculus cassubicifolius]
MNRGLVSIMNRQLARSQTPNISRSSCDVFINHRGIDTKQSVSGLLYNSLSNCNVRAFLDSQSMKPGDKLFEKIYQGIRDCKVGVIVFSPNYCDSYFCLHELALIMESRKKVIPIFCDIKPSDLRVLDNGTCSKYEITRFRWALEEARYTVGITFDSRTGNWPDLVRRATDAIVETLIDVEQDEYQGGRYSPTFF